MCTIVSVSPNASDIARSILSVIRCPSTTFNLGLTVTVTSTKYIKPCERPLISTTSITPLTFEQFLPSLLMSYY